MRFVEGLVSVIYSNRVSVGTHFLPFENQKRRFVLGPERDVSRYDLALFVHFLPTTKRKMRLGGSRDIDVSSCPLAMRQ
jgi:hypothetical protein